MRTNPGRTTEKVRRLRRKPIRVHGALLWSYLPFIERTYVETDFDRYLGRIAGRSSKHVGKSSFFRGRLRERIVRFPQTPFSDFSALMPEVPDTGPRIEIAQGVQSTVPGK